MRTFFATALAMLTLASCSKNERDGGSPDLPSTISKAYMSLSVQFPQGTKATASVQERKRALRRSRQYLRYGSSLLMTL